MDRDVEIAEIRRELDILRARHALYARWGRIVKAFFGLGVPLLVIVLAIAGVAWGDADPLIAGVFAVVAIAICSIVYLISSSRDARRGWIDLVSPPTRFGFRIDGVRDLFVARPSDAMIIEEQIDARERRLAELGVQP